VNARSVIMGASTGTLIPRANGLNRDRRAIPAAALLIAALAAGCAPRASEPTAREPLAVDVYADTGRGVALPVREPGAPRASVWLDRVTPVRIVPATAGEPPAPGAAPETLASRHDPAPAPSADEELKPPLLRGRGALVVPRAAPAAVVELDVRVDEQGRVSDAIWAAGNEDTALVRAATECALGMTFFPALRSGRPVAVWCRQRFDFGARDRR
jgi:hypothetical protein